MKRIISNILLFLVAILLLLTLGVLGLIYTLIYSLFNLEKVDFVKYWGDLLYSINVGIDKIGNVLLGAFLNKSMIMEKTYIFGSINHTISHVLAYNYFKENVTPLGLLLVDILEKIDPGHMEESLKK